MIIYGARASKIGNFDTQNIKCPYCEQESNQRLSIFGKYVHIFWIPIFPIGKKAISECSHCNKTIEQKEFLPELTKFYLENKSKIKRPFWHWIGLGIITLLVSLMAYIISTNEPDPRSELLQTDIRSMVSNPTMETDSIAYKLKEVFDYFTTEEINPSEFEYLTRMKNDKALILITIPNLKKVEKESRAEVLDIIEMVINDQEDLRGIDQYVGVHGKFNMMLIKTPIKQENRNFVIDNVLYEFYGPVPKKIK